MILISRSISSVEVADDEEDGFVELAFSWAKDESDFEEVFDRARGCNAPEEDDRELERPLFERREFRLRDFAPLLDLDVVLTGTDGLTSLASSLAAASLDCCVFCELTRFTTNLT